MKIDSMESVRPKDIDPGLCFGASSGDTGRAGFLGSISRMVHYPASSVLYREGSPAVGMYIIHSGSVRLSITSPRGKTLVLSAAGPGDFLGLSSAVSGKAYEATALTTDTSDLGFISRTMLLAVLEEHPGFYLDLATILSQNVYSVYEQARALTCKH